MTAIASLPRKEQQHLLAVVEAWMKGEQSLAGYNAPILSLSFTVDATPVLLIVLGQTR
jgi:hypothetical protein